VKTGTSDQLVRASTAFLVILTLRVSCRLAAAHQMGLAAWQADSSLRQKSPAALGFRSGRPHQPSLRKCGHTLQVTAGQEPDKGIIISRPKNGARSNARLQYTV